MNHTLDTYDALLTRCTHRVSIHRVAPEECKLEIQGRGLRGLRKIRMQDPWLLAWSTWNLVRKKWEATPKQSQTKRSSKSEGTLWAWNPRTRIGALRIGRQSLRLQELSRTESNIFILSPGATREWQLSSASSDHMVYYRAFLIASAQPSTMDLTEEGWMIWFCKVSVRRGNHCCTRARLSSIHVKNLPPVGWWSIYFNISC